MQQQIAGESINVINSPQIGGDFNIFNAPDVLYETRLMHVNQADETALVEPSQLDPLLAIVTQHGAIVLTAPSYWGSRNVAEALAKALLIQAGAAAPWTVLYGEGLNISSLRRELERKNRSVRGVILIDRPKLETDTLLELPTLARLAAARQQRLILIADYADPLLHEAMLRPYIVKLNEQSPYSAADLDRFWQQQHADRPGLPSARLDDPRLNSTGALTSLLQTMTGALETRSPQRIVDEFIQQRDQQLHTWYDNLHDDEKFVVLTLALVDTLPQETFWALYEELIVIWRQRITQLNMSDYRALRDKLNTYIVFETDRAQSIIRFRTDDARRALIRFISERHRRALIDALPLLADLVTGVSRPRGTVGSAIKQLRSRDIFGSELLPSTENSQRRRAIRERLLDSIVQIREFEPHTTEHLLEIWAEGKPDDEVVDQDLREAFCDTLIRIAARGERDSSFNLLARWYRSYQGELYPFLINQLETVTTADDIQQTMLTATNSPLRQQDQRRGYIRASMAQAILKLAASLPQAEFGAAETAGSLLTVQPLERPVPTTLWHLLACLLWDDQAIVRTRIAQNAFYLLLSGYQTQFEQIILVLAGDPALAVRGTLGLMLGQTVEKVPALGYLISHLLDVTGDPVQRLSAADDDEDNKPAVVYPAYWFTAFLAALWVGRTDEAYLTSVLHTFPLTAEDKLFKAANAVFDLLAQSPDLIAPLKRPLRQVLLDTDATGQPSAIAQAAYQQLKLARRVLTKDEERVLRTALGSVLPV